MKNKKILITVLISILLIFTSFTVYSQEYDTTELSEKYEEWLALPEEKKEGTIAPLPFNVRETKDSGISRKIKNLFKSITLEERYDLREHIEVEVKNQMDTGLCWGFSANTSVETNLALNNKEYNLSERHLEYNTAGDLIKDENDSLNEDALNRTLGSGGYSSTAFTYYSRGSGPILEEDMPFENNEIAIKISEVPTNSAIQKVDNMVYFPNIYKYRDENNNLIYEDANGIEYTKTEVQTIRNQVKEHIMKNGGISAAVCAPNFWYNESTYADNMYDFFSFANHAVTIIGWDDEYPVENFINQPSEPGAYIVLNSWGKDWGENGVYYVSYEDCLIESEMRGVMGVSDVEYDNLYQHDTSEVWNDIESKYGANVFTANDDEVLKEVMIASLTEQTCDVYINMTGDDLNINNLTKIASNVNLRPGYNTVKIEESIELSKGNKFAIVVKITSDNYSGIGIEDNNQVWFGNAISNPEESFISDDGLNWTDIYDKYNLMNLSIKAYTQTKEKNFEVTEIKGKGYEEVGGKYCFSIKTSHLEKENIVDISIYDKDNNKIEGFEIKGNKIRGNGTYITLNCQGDLIPGEYYVDIKLSDFETVRKKLIVRELSDDLIILQFSDEKFLEVINATLQNSFINKKTLQLITNQEEIDNLTILNNAYNKGIVNIDGIENFKSLRVLRLDSNNISDISVLKNLKKLEELTLDQNIGITDFTPITNLTELTYLSLQLNRINNLDFLNNLSKLRYLSLVGSAPQEKIDISNIFKLTELYNLNLHGWEWLTENELIEVNKLTNLKNLDLNACNIGNIEFLRNMKLESLTIGNASYLIPGKNHVSDLSPIEDMETLNYLILNGLEDLENLNSLKNLKNLTGLNVEYGRLRDATALDSDTFKDRVYWDNLWLIGNNIFDYIYTTENKIETVKIPKIFEQACNSESVLYSEAGIELYGCQWDEFGKSLLVDTSNTGLASIRINSGYAQDTWYYINIEKYNIEKIELKQPPIKLDYILGEDLDLAGGRISVTDDEWITRDLSMMQTGVNIVSYDKTKLGQQTVVIEYEGQQIEFDINVTNELEKLEWYVDGEKLVTNEDGTYNMNLGQSKEIKLYGIKENGEKVDLSEECVIYSKDENIVKIDNGIINALNYGTVEISFLNNNNNLQIPEKFIINVIGVKSIEILTFPEKLSYRVDESIDLTGGVLSITNFDDTIEAIPMTDENVSITVIGLEDLQDWNPKIKLTYKGKSIEFNISRNRWLNFKEIDKIVDNKLALESISGIEIDWESDLSKLDYLKLFPNIFEIIINGIDLQDISILNEITSNNEIYIRISNASINLNGINNKEITGLSLNYCTVSNLKDIKNLTGLYSLEIECVEGYEDFDCSNFEKLENFAICKNSIQNSHELLNQLSELQNLRYLYLRGSNIKDSDTEYLAKIKMLDSLDISDTYITDISFLKNFKSLSHLVLPYGVQDLNVIYSLDNLNSLVIEGYTETNIDSNLINYLEQNELWYTNFDKDISNKIEQIIETLEITDLTTDEEKVRKVTEYVVEYMDYNEEMRYDNTILDRAINYRVGRTEEYSMLEYTLLRKVGIEAYYVDGYIGGSWNIVKLNGKWYGIDTFSIDITGGNAGWERSYLKNPINDDDVNNYMFASEHKSYVNPYNDLKILTSIEIEKEPTKTEYILGEDLDFTDGIVRLIYDNGSIEKISMAEDDIEIVGGTDQVGEQIITIKYRGHETAFTIKVVNELIEINISKLPNKLTYILGEDLDLSGGIITLIYQNGTTSEIAMIAEGVDQSGTYDKTKLGKQTIIIEYQGKTAEFEVEYQLPKIEIEKLEIDFTEFSEEQGIVSNIDAGMKTQALKETIQTNGQIKLYTKDDVLIETDEILATGMKLEISLGEETLIYTLAITGDCNGDGKVRVGDLTTMMVSVAENLAANKDTSKILEGAWLKAVDLNSDGKLSVSDITMLKILIAENK